MPGTTTTRPAPTDGAGPARPARGARPACAVCGSRLSRYNERDTCYAHTLDVPWKGPHRP